MAHEIITIQGGKYSNFIGTHWWNIQESSFCYSPDNSIPLDINHDATFREGFSSRGEVTYTPRLVLIDLQDNFQSLSKESLYKEGKSTSKTYWDGPIEVFKDKPVKRNPYLKDPHSSTDADSSETEQMVPIEDAEFDDPSVVWSDYLKTYLHPNSLCLLNELYSSEDADPLELYSNGEEVYGKKGEMFEESLRKMAEDCDHLQGFQLIYDAYNGFSGVSNKILQYLDDEYKRRPSLCFPVYQEDKGLPVQDIKKQMHRLYATLMSMSSLNSYCTLFSPLSLTDDVVKLSYPYRKFPYLHYNEKLLYHTSAILAAAIETLSSPFRLRSIKYSLYDVTTTMSTYNRKMVCSSICLPFPLSHNSYLSAMVEKEVPQYYMTSLTPFYKADSERTLFQSAVLRGVPVNKFQNPDKFRHHSSEGEEVFGEYLNKYSPSSVVMATVYNEKCSVPKPFPKIFKDVVSESGFLNSTTQNNQTGVDKIPVAASFSNSDSSSKFIDELLSQASKVSFKEYVKCVETTYEKDDHHELIENLIGLQDNYTSY